ncbi:MAG: hypothetical protein JW929_09165 [Anaerolineales bacterium]|nr:hypothetical protein [Anaerolineales bacterium]
MTPQTRSASAWRGFLLLLLLLTASAAAWMEAFFIRRPGTMDACYYYSGGVNLVRGTGWQEFFLWNYLDEEAEIPYPAYQYWMPLASFVAAAGMGLLGEGFRQAQAPLLLLAVSFPWLAFLTGKQLTGSFRVGILAGFFAIGSGFYTVYWLNTESFLIYAWIGGLTLLLAARSGRSQTRRRVFLIGALCGLAHLARADGILLLGVAAILILADGCFSYPARAGRTCLLAAGYFLTSGIWYLRNLRVWGSPFPPGTGKAFFLNEYNDLFRYPSADLTLERFLSAGLEDMLAARWEAFQANLTTTVFVLGLVFLFPLMAWGAYLLRRKSEIRTAAGYLLILFFLMTAVYPFQGSRGGFLHSSAALIPAAAAAAALGLEDVVERLIRWRKWEAVSARAFLGAGMAGLALSASAFIYYSRVVGSASGGSAWDGLNVQYVMGVSRLEPVPPGTIRFMVNNPPCFYVRTGYPGLPVPAGDSTMLLEAADRYGVRFVVLDGNAPEGLQSLYRGTDSHPRLRRIFSLEYDGMEYVWFEVIPAAPGTDS